MMPIKGLQKTTLIDFPGKVACTIFLGGCNFRCGYCHNPEFVLPDMIQKIKDSFIPEDAFFSFLQSREGLLDGVVISGGEPTIMPDLPKFISKIKEIGFQIKLDTNGTNPVMVTKLIDQNLVDYIAMDYKTSIVDYSRFTSNSAAFNDAIITTRELLKQGLVPYECRSTLAKEIHTEDMLRSMIDELAGAQALFLQSFRPEHTLDPVYSAYQ